MLFNGSLLHYSYDACGHAPDCYNSFGADARCPYDPHENQTYQIFKEGCECIFHGLELPFDVYTDFPSEMPGMYSSLGLHKPSVDNESH